MDGTLLKLKLEELAPTRPDNEKLILVFWLKSPLMNYEEEDDDDDDIDSGENDNNKLIEFIVRDSNWSIENNCFFCDDKWNTYPNNPKTWSFIDLSYVAYIELTYSHGKE